ncbi:3-hydroxyacyl-CoA dehydrogenase family protein, partial [Haladaptatus sp.]|uniref:3-hydroxyacyl-CoA dehydrogenase family protein n=1 Tax=Haladaptatus sp. TaxID=1973141 RepID=UPI003C644746
MKVGVLGAGTMGHGIAQVTAMAGHDVTLRDIEEEFVKNGIESIEANLQGGVERDKVTEAEKEAALGRISGTTDLEAAVTDADMVVEAVPEKMEIKRETFADVEEFASDDAIIASNTSSLSLTEIASALNDPSRAIGLHFFNPVHIMKLVEIVIPEQSSSKTVEFASEFVDGIDKVGVEVNDSPG